MNAYDVFVDPSVISACISCHFINSREKHLIVAKATLLEIYEVLQSERVSPAKGFDYKLKMIDSFKLQGTVTRLKPIRTLENPDLDYLLVLTKSARVSCIRWDQFKHSITTVSLHFYEHIMENSTYETVHESDLIVGSSSRPLFCLRRNNLLVFLPFNSADDDDQDEDDENGNYSKKNTDSSGAIRDSNSDGNKVGSVDRASDSELFESSVVIDASSLDSSVGDIVDFQFLHNYREPTVAVLSQSKDTWAGLLPSKQDNVVYSVWSLDVASATVTTVLKIQKLPFDIHRIVPLEYPLNGSLLVGCNELVHVDSGGITRRIALNSFVSECASSFRDFLDLSSKELMLEDCEIAPIPNDNKVLMILRNGDIHLIDFDVDGKTIKGLNVHELDMSSYGSIRIENPGTVVALRENVLFISGRSSDSAIVEVSYSEQEKNHIDSASFTDGTFTTGADEKQGEYIDEEDDDLYDDDKIEKTERKYGSLVLTKHDVMRNHGPISSFTLGKISSEKFVANLPNPSFNDIAIVAAGGVGSSAHLDIMTPTVQPMIRSSLRFSQIHRLWIISNRFLITSDDSDQKSEVFDINKSYSRIPAKHFVNTELTIAMHELDGGNFILQVTPKRVILFNDKLKKIVSLEKQLKEFGEAYIVNSVFNDELLMIFFSTGEVAIYSINTYSKVFSKIELPKLLSDTIITTGYITNSRLLNVVSRDITVLMHKGQKRKHDSESVSHPKEAIASSKLKTFVLVTGDNRVVVFGRFHNEKCFQLNSVNKFSNRLTLGFFDINGEDPDPFIKQVILNDLGDNVAKDEYLTILTVGGEILAYKMYFDGENYSFVKEVNLPITGAPQNAYQFGTSLERRMIYFPNVSGITCVLVTGVVPYLVTRSKNCLVRIHKFSKIPIISFVSFSDEKIKNGLIYLDTNKNARIVELSEHYCYDGNWPVRRIPVGETIKSVAYHESSHTYIVSTFKEIPYNCVDEDGSPIVGTKSDKPSALSYKGRVLLISPISWTSIDSISLDDNEIGLQVKSLALDIGSENKRYKRKKELILIGSGKYRMEDLSANGSYTLLEIIDIVPEPGKPETNHKFKEITREDTKGAVTAICDVSGRFLIAQGQKIIVRDIKDTTAVPVAFMDLSMFISEAKSFGNLVLLGDTMKGVSLAGFDAEPFRMLPLSKDTQENDVNCADFIYKDEDMFIVAADNDQMIHVLQYNPEDPKSSNGQRLLRRSSFNTNFSTTCMKTIPKHEQVPESIGTLNMPLQNIASTAEGAMYVVFPVSEITYKRMFILQQQLTDKQYHHCGLNPRLNRIGDVETETEQNSRPILDCEILKRYTKLNSDRRRALGQKMSIKNISADTWRDLIEFENVFNKL